jgi:hypothetical protein
VSRLLRCARPIDRLSRYAAQYLWNVLNPEGLPALDFGQYHLRVIIITIRTLV